MELEKNIKEQTKGLTELENLEYLHNFITDNIKYDKEHRSRSALVAAITHKGTCTAFAQLFLILGEDIGLKVGCINSKILKHRWNYVIPYITLTKPLMCQTTHQKDYSFKSLQYT